MRAKRRRASEQLGIYNATVKCFDGTLGWAANAPYDAILVAAGGPNIPEPLVAQLKIGGRWWFRLARRANLRRLVRVIKTEKGIEREDHGACAFVPLIGQHGWSAELRRGLALDRYRLACRRSEIELMDSLYELFHQLRELLNPKIIIETLLAKGGIFVYFGLIFIVFAETGLAVGFFLPGDSLLVVAGLFAATGKLNLAILLSTLFVAAVVGDAVGYYTGAQTRAAPLQATEVAFVSDPVILQKAHAFYEKYGGKTIVIARFVPIVRTFAPIVAGAAQMPYRRFVVFNVVGGFLWVFSMILSGYFLGSLLKSRFGIDLDEHIEWVVIIVVAAVTDAAVH